MSSLRGKIPGIAAKTNLIPKKAIKLPKHAPLSERITLSVNSCRTRRARFAPSAERMANSLLRAAERTSSRLAIFVQVINNTSPTAPDSNASV